MNNNENEKQAAALKYSEEDNAPRVVALGKRETAQRIIDTAKESGVPVYENEALAKSLNKLNLGQEIPRELYEIVAQVLVYIAEMDSKR